MKLPSIIQKKVKPETDLVILDMLDVETKRPRTLLKVTGAALGGCF